jgi:hypothetical protein
MPGTRLSLISLGVHASLESSSARFGVLRHFAPHDAHTNNRHSTRLSTVPEFQPGRGGTGRLSTEVKRTEGSHEGDKCPCRRDTSETNAIARWGGLTQQHRSGSVEGSDQTAIDIINAAFRVHRL